MQKQVNRPFIKRYLKRDDILEAIQGSDTELDNALSVFSVCLLSLPRVSPDTYLLRYSVPSKSVSYAGSGTDNNEPRWKVSSLL